MRGHLRKRCGCKSQSRCKHSWIMVVDVDPGADGRRRQKWVSTGTHVKADAEKVLRKHLGVLDGGGDPFPEAVTLSAFVHDRLVPHWQTQGRPREATWTRYVELLDRWVLPSIGGLDLARIGPRHVQAALDGVVAAGKAPRTVQHVRAATSAVFTAALRWELVAVNPVRATETPTASKPELLTPSAAELLELVDAAVGTPWAVPVLLSATTGARRSEVLAVRWSGVDLDEGRVQITEQIIETSDGLDFGAPKTASAVGSVPLPSFAVARLRAYRRDQAARRLAMGTDWHDFDLVYERGDGTPISPGAYTHGFARLAARSGYDGVRLHDLRHGVATAVAKSGMSSPVATAAMLGHTDPGFTQRTYTHADDEMVTRAAAGLEAAFGGA